MGLKRALGSLNSKIADLTGFKGSLLSLLSGSSALVVITVVAFFLAAPQAISAQDMIRKRAEVTIASSQGQVSEVVDSSDSSSSEILDFLDPSNDENPASNTLFANDVDSTPNTFGGAESINETASNGDTESGAQQGKNGSSFPAATPPSKSGSSGSKSISGNASQQSPAAGTSSENKTPSTSTTANPGGATSNAYNFELNSLQSAASDFNKHISALSSAVESSGIMKTSYHPGSSFRDTARKYIVIANKALDYTTNFAYDYKSSGKYSDLSNRYNKIIAANKHLASAATLLKSYCENFLSCPNLSSHYSCFTDCLKGHQVTERTSHNTIAYKMDHIENAVKAWEQVGL